MYRIFSWPRSSASQHKAWLMLSKTYLQIKEMLSNSIIWTTFWPHYWPQVFEKQWIYNSTYVQEPSVNYQSGLVYRKGKYLLVFYTSCFRFLVCLHIAHLCSCLELSQGRERWTIGSSRLLLSVFQPFPEIPPFWFPSAAWQVFINQAHFTGPGQRAVKP